MRIQEVKNEGQALLHRKSSSKEMEADERGACSGSEEGLGWMSRQMKQGPWCVLDQPGYGVLRTFKGEDIGIVETD